MNRVLLGILCPLALLAQTATVQGIVTDPSGSAIPDASVSAVLESTGAVRTVATGADGRYSIPALTVGSYTIRCEKTGFKTAEFHEVALSLNRTIEQEIRLNVADANVSVDVKEQPDALNTTGPTAGVGIEGEVLEETPSQNRSYLGAVLMAPSVAPAAGSNALRSKAGIRSANPDSGFTFAGMRPRNNSLMIDGLDNRDETTGASRATLGQEVVSEFRVSATDIAPEFGGGAGGNLNVVTFSGTNKFHGDVNLFAGDSFLDARSPESDTNAIPARREYQPEANLNGPLKRDRTFFAATIEGELENGQESSEIGQPGLEPRIESALAGPLFARSGVHRISDGFFHSASSSTLASFKLTHMFTPKRQVVARWSFTGADVAGEVLGTNNFSDASARGSSHSRDQEFGLSWQEILSPRFVNEVRFLSARRRVALTPNSEGPLLEIPGIVSLGESPVLNATRTEDHLEFVDSATFVRGNHQIGFGGTVQRIGLDANLANNFAGIFVFPTVGAFTSGMPSMFIQAFGNPHTNYSTEPVGLWIQDQWRPLPGLTITGGVRYEAQKLPVPFGSVTHNVAPRLGLAWQPAGRGKWVVRAGAGLFYDRFPLAFLNEAIQKNGVNAFEQYAEGAQAANIFALSQGGTLVAPMSGIAPSIYRPQPGFADNSTYARKFSAGVERAIDADTTVTVEYMNVNGYHLPRLLNAALTLPPQFLLEQSASSQYQGVSVTLRRRLSKELTYLIGYTGSSSWDDASDFDEQPLNPANTRLDWARSRQYQAHRVVASTLFDLPFDDIGAPKWLQKVGNNFSLAPIISAGSPRPVNAVATTDLYGTGAYPLTARPAGLGRNPFYERGQFNVDLRITKGFVWWQDHGIFLFGMGIYNLTNHTNAITVSDYYGLSTYRGIIEALNARQVQFSFQWEF